MKSSREDGFPLRSGLGLLALIVVHLISSMTVLAFGQHRKYPKTDLRERVTPILEAQSNNSKSERSLNSEHWRPMTEIEKRTYGRAATAFASFCRDWERKLHDREVDNRAHLEWRENRGYQTTTFVGYGMVESCQCKISEQGSPLGELKYNELSYYLVGKTIDEARRAKPLLYGITHTLEIFSWENNRWWTY